MNLFQFNPNLPASLPSSSLSSGLEGRSHLILNLHRLSQSLIFSDSWTQTDYFVSDRQATSSASHNSVVGNQTKRRIR